MTVPSPALSLAGIDTAALLLSQASRVVVLCTVSLDGANVQSAAARSDRGLWRNLAHVGQWRAPVRTAERPHSQWARQRLAQTASARPGAAHVALTQLQTLLRGSKIVTDGSDLLLEAAGARRVWHLHGHVPGERCTRCAAVRVRQPQGASAPCQRCGATRLEDWPGESRGNPPQQAWTHALHSLRACDAVLWLADEDMVYPAAEFAYAATAHGAKLVLASRTPTGLDHLAAATLRGGPRETLTALAGALSAARMGGQAA